MLFYVTDAFDLLHPGHVMHLQEAKKMGTFLAVSLTLDEYVNKGPGRPVWSWEQRVIMLRALRCVDTVVASKCSEDAILKVRPHIFVKGIDYIEKGLRPQDIRACAEVGAQIRFTQTEKLSATDIIKKARIL